MFKNIKNSGILVADLSYVGKKSLVLKPCTFSDNQQSLSILSVFLFKRDPVKSIQELNFIQFKSM